MHAYFYARGIYNQVELWKTLAQGHFWKWTRKNLKTGKDETCLVQGALRPSVLGTWEYVFPEECLSEMISVFGQAEHESSHKDKRYILLRKMIGCKRIPHKYFEEAKKIPASISVDNCMRGLSGNNVHSVGVHLIGYKEDTQIELLGYEQEAL